MKLRLICTASIVTLALILPLIAAGMAVDTDAAATFTAAARQAYQKAHADDATVIAGQDGWLLLPSELRHLTVGEFWGERAAEVSKASKPQWADPTPAILDFKKQLDELGVKLIVIPVPAKAAVYPDKLTDAIALGADGLPPRVDTYDAAYYALLKDKGVEVMDITPMLIKARATDADAGPTYCRTDTHYSPRACTLIARAVADKLNAAGLTDGVQTREDILCEQREIAFVGDLTRMQGGDAKETLPARIVGTRGDAGLTPLPEDDESPFLLLGDSHGLIFNAGGDMHARGAGLADQLAAELKTGIDLIAVRGSGATPARINLMRKSRRNADYLKNKKAVIWCFSAREFTEASAWRNVPLTR